MSISYSLLMLFMTSCHLCSFLPFEMSLSLPTRRRGSLTDPQPRPRHRATSPRRRHHSILLFIASGSANTRFIGYKRWQQLDKMCDLSFAGLQSLQLLGEPWRWRRAAVAPSKHRAINTINPLPLSILRTSPFARRLSSPSNSDSDRKGWTICPLPARDLLSFFQSAAADTTPSTHRPLNLPGPCASSPCTLQALAMTTDTRSITHQLSDSSASSRSRALMRHRCPIHCPEACPTLCQTTACCSFWHLSMAEWNAGSGIRGLPASSASSPLRHRHLFDILSTSSS
ncbi:hypothetical protein K402DRAFT_399292 [Aulographum hederae CBS 113979]|uniref:Uncharacterized protein n=1 Tax=Aulographum hederae CBS 113979 TaxID=1176131 RepID=A0A6G1GHZ2_9PEZI|nr:hypothetical protein K402DRAFT_399292 [Aulographum hederae CBS 113979]